MDIFPAKEFRHEDRCPGSDELRCIGWLYRFWLTCQDLSDIQPGLCECADD
ncbi:Unknown protein sequence [Pseudomonas amygdali pv. lachrymans]|uniref:Uncharacterized protein n=1 Tax=Pseudomonas amygdali pv. lachrymans TaxID=53707 RepID=A0ABR5KXR3_PSEAV|nr:hypothetical protein AC519_3925 [Pseudomonas savastanoi]KPC19820.1 Unknown protein sequence [Pseudomonas amygdali pv. lachrymans]KPC32242.1 Unknown protein sequence [Pseudomonas savastanoi pv. glycinea]KPC45249.1 Unknown protein sequence [Pseudomonas savastanoi pv. glycinea]